MAKLTVEAEGLARSLAEQYELQCRVERVEEFAATVNDVLAYSLLEKAAAVSGREIIHESRVFS